MNNVKKTVTTHDHAAQAARSEAIRIIDEMKHWAATTQELPQQILSTAVQNTHANVLAVLPRKESLKRTIRNVRNQNGGASPLPNTLADLIFPQKYKEIMVDGNAQPFLMYDSDQMMLPGHVLIFTTPDNLRILAES
uniref:Uncharacterized protein n=1 Tax=Romanomermis culicivorax TaxID=13658 RepID=A0A915J2B0_ROMCU